MTSRIVVGRHAARLAAVAVLAGGCGTEPGCDVCTTSAVVYGRVTTQGGAAVAGATVAATPYADSCAGQAVWGDEPALTDAAGRYRVHPRIPAAPFVACVRVRARASTGAEATAESAPVRFREDYRPRGRDSVRVDLTLPTP